MTRRATLRASDADRELIAERLREAAAEGRLFADELEERLGAALSARTYGELDAVVADLPGPSPALARSPRGDAHPSHPLRPVVAVLVALTVAVTLIGAVASALLGHGHPNHGGFGAGPLIWLVWIALGWRFWSRRRRAR